MIGSPSFVFLPYLLEPCFCDTENEKIMVCEMMVWEGRDARVSEYFMSDEMIVFGPQMAEVILIRPSFGPDTRVC